MTVRSGALGTIASGGMSAQISSATLAAQAQFAGAGGLSAMPLYIYLRPDGDALDGGWTNQMGGTILFPSIDEAAPPIDTDYIQSSAAPAADICRVSLDNPSGGVGSLPGKVRTRYKNAGSGNNNLTVSLKQGSTVIASWTYSSIPSTFTTAEETLTAPQFASITDFSDLFLEYQADNVAAYVGPGDVVGSADNWYGLRAYTLASVGANAVRLRESGGNTEQDFATITGGGLDLAAIATFKGANNLFVVKLYDQVGGNDLVQATAGNQPAFILSGLGSLPVIRFTKASSQYLETANNFSQAQPFTLSTVAKRTGSTSTHCCVVGASSTIILLGFANSTDTPEFYPLSNTGADNVWHAMQGVANGATGNDCNIDGNSSASSSMVGQSFGTEKLQFGCSTTSNFHDGDATEAGMWPIQFSGANCTAMSTNQHNYWGF